MSIGTIQADQFDGLARLVRDHGTVHLADLLNELARRRSHWDKAAADGAAATATTEHAFERKPADSQVVRNVVFVPDAALVAHAANNATIIVRKRKTDGSTPVTVASITTAIAAPGSGDWTAFVAVPFVLASEAARSLLLGESLTVEITKATAGVVVPAGRLVVEYN